MLFHARERPSPADGTCRVSPTGDPAGDVRSGLPGVCGVLSRLQGLPVRAALSRQLCVHGKNLLICNLVNIHTFKAHWPDFSV